MAAAEAAASATLPGAAPAREPDHAPDGYAPDGYAPDGYALVWSDEFDGVGLPDASRWGYDTHRNQQGWYNDELQYYAANRLENARVEDGRLIIEARQERLTRRRFPDFSGQQYSSARLLTQGRASWTYGFFEIRAKLPCGVGTWPAIWMLPEDAEAVWPHGGEIDIMEHVGFAPGEINQTIHTAAFNHVLNTQRTAKFMVPDACEAMHRYQMLWTPERIVTSVDDQPRFEFRRVAGDRSRWPFDRPMHLLLNIAVGGDWGGQQGVSTAAFPARMEVDYVRVYQRAATAEPTAAPANDVSPPRMSSTETH